jgi:hypothetical protein
VHSSLYILVSCIYAYSLHVPNSLSTVIFYLSTILFEMPIYTLKQHPSHPSYQRK